MVEYLHTTLSRFCAPGQRPSRAFPSRPARLRRQGHQDGFGVAAGHQAELGAAVVEQVEFDVAPAAHELPVALLGGPGLVHVAADDAGIDLEEGAADVLDEGEAGIPGALQIVEEEDRKSTRL